METYENIKCPKCGTIAVKGTKKCVKCHTLFAKQYKSCPKCAKRNSLDATKCISCGYNFNKKQRSLVTNLIISIAIIIILFILVGLEYTGIVKKVNIFFKILAIFLIIITLISNLKSNKKEIVDYIVPNPTPVLDKKYKRLKNLTSIFLVIICLFIISIIAIYFFNHR